MKYFLHDTRAFEDEKIIQIFDAFGYEGLGLFYTILEKIGAQEKPIKTIALKSQLRIGKRLEKCWQFLEQIGVISSSNDHTFNERILSYSEMYQIKKQKTREKIAQWREKQKDMKNVTGNKTVSNPPKVKLSKVKESNRAKALSVSGETGMQEILKKTYEELTSGLSGKDEREIFTLIRDFVSTNKPSFAEPYVDAWNIFAPKNSLSSVKEITAARRAKIKIRTREDPFDFFGILNSIRRDDFLRGDSKNGWKVTFDYVIENQSNYIKIIEKIIA